MEAFSHHHSYADEQIERTIRELIHNSRQVNDSSLEIAVNDGDVTLSGTVKSEAERYRCENLMAMIQGVTSVHNELSVR